MNITVDKDEHMIGSYGANAEPYAKNFPTEESPSGMIARSGTYHVRSRLLDDDKTIYAGALVSCIRWKYFER